MFQYFNCFLLSELHLLNQEDASLHEWHNCTLGTTDHNRRCTLEWVSRQFQSYAPDPTITIDTLTDSERFHFNLLLTWAYSVWIAQYGFYHKGWEYARAKDAPTWWLDYTTNLLEDDWGTKLPIWYKPPQIPTIAWATWITWTESR